MISKAINLLKRKINKLFIYNLFFDLPILLKETRRIYIDTSSHPFWATYKTNPPLPYLRNSLYSILQHKFNRYPKNTNKPFIIDCEHILHLSGYSRDYKKMVEAAPIIEKIVSLPTCKAVIGPTWGTLNDALKYFKNKEVLINKFVKILPAIEVKEPKDYSTLKHKPFTILNIGNKFWGKGTHITIEVFKRLREKHGSNVKLVLVCNDVPPDYELCEGIDVIKVFQLTSANRDKLYNEAHVFLFPCLHDSFGVYLEALAYGVPMLSTRIYDKDEIVMDGETGYLFDTPISLYDGGFGVDWKVWDEFQTIIQEKHKAGAFETLIEHMSQKIEFLMHHPEILEQLSIGSQRFCKSNLNVERRNKEILELYNAKLIGGN